MAGEWTTVALGDVAETRNGAGIKQDFFSLTGIPLVRVSDFTDWSIDMTNCIRVDNEHSKRWENHKLDEGDVVVATVGSWPPNWSSVVGKAVRVPRSAAGAIQNQNTCCVFARPGITDQRFLFYLLRTEAFVHHAANAAGGSANQARLPVANLARFSFGLPPLPEQRAIAHILGILDDRIELNRRINETLEAMARSLFKSWFVDFDPVRSKAEGRNPGLPQSLAALFPDSFEDSELGEIPRGWGASKIGDEVVTVLGGTPARAEPRYWGGDIPWINSGKANEFRVVEPSEFITKGGLDSSATKLLPSRTTVIAITGATLGQVSLTEIATCANQSIVGVIGKAELPSEFLYFWVKSRIADLLAWETGGAQQHINKNNVNDLRVLVPSEPIMRTFIAQARPYFDRIRDCCLESRTLAALRDTLLPKLISGELRVKDAKPFRGQRS